MRVLVLILTAIHLGVQLAFNATLLDLVHPLFVSAALATNVVELISRIAEVLTGVTLALVAIRWLVTRGPAPERFTWRRTAAAGAIVVVALAFSTTVQRTLIDRLVRDTTGAQRQTALLVALASAGLVNGMLTAKSLGLDEGTEFTPAKRLAVVFLGPLLIWSEGVGLIEEVAPRIAQSMLYRNRSIMAPHFNRALAPHCEEVRAQHTKYAEVSRKHLSGDGLFTALKLRVFRLEVNRRLGFETTLPPGLHWDAFIVYPDIQAGARDRVYGVLADLPLPYQISGVVTPRDVLLFVNAALAGQVMDPCMRWRDFEREHLPVVLGAIPNLFKAVGAEASDIAGLEERGQFEEIGRRAVKIALLGPLSLSLSLLAWVLGVGLIAGTLLRSYARAPLWLTGLGIAGLLIAVAWYPLTVANPVTASTAYQQRMASARINMGPALIGGADWVLRTEPLVYPAGIAIRKALLRYGLGVPADKLELAGLIEHFTAPSVQTLLEAKAVRQGEAPP